MATDFTKFLTDIDHGRLHQVAGEQLERMADAVALHGEPGKFTLTIQVDRKGDRAVVTAKLKVDTPSEPIATTLMHFGRDGGLQRDDPRQMSLKDLAEQTTKETKHHGN